MTAEDSVELMNGASRIAVVGAGLIGREHIRRILEEPTMALAAIVDVSLASRLYAAELKTPHFEDLAECLREVRIDGLIIASPTKYLSLIHI